MTTLPNFPAPAQGRKCRICGCTDHNACVDELGGACFWVEADLCSECMAWKRAVKSGPLIETPLEALFDDDEPTVVLATDAQLNAMIAEHRRLYGGVYVG